MAPSVVPEARARATTTPHAFATVASIGRNPFLETSG